MGSGHLTCFLRKIADKTIVVSQLTNEKLLAEGHNRKVKQHILFCAHKCLIQLAICDSSLRYAG